MAIVRASRVGLGLNMLQDWHAMAICRPEHGPLQPSIFESEFCLCIEFCPVQHSNCRTHHLLSPVSCTLPCRSMSYVFTSAAARMPLGALKCSLLAMAAIVYSSCLLVYMHHCNKAHISSANHDAGLVRPNFAYLLYPQLTCA